VPARILIYHLHHRDQGCDIAVHRAAEIVSTHEICETFKQKNNLTYPMNGGAIVLHAVLDRDADCVAPSGSDGRPWKLSIEEQTGSVTTAIRIAGGIGDLQIVCHGVSCGRELLVEVGSNAVAVLPACSCGWSIDAGCVAFNEFGIGSRQDCCKRKRSRSN